MVLHTYLKNLRHIIFFHFFAMQGTLGNCYLSPQSNVLQPVGEALAVAPVASLENGPVAGGGGEPQPAIPPGMPDPSVRLLISEYSREGVSMAGGRVGEMGDPNGQEGQDPDGDNLVNNGDEDDGGGEFDDEDSVTNSRSTTSTSQRGGAAGFGQPGSPGSPVGPGGSAVHKKRRYKEFAAESEGHYVCRVCGDRVRLSYFAACV